MSVDLSPMIDLVFLLLIFFMTSSTIITYLKDQRVMLPVAEDARVPKAVKQRVIINVYENGDAGDEHGVRLSRTEMAARLRAAVGARPEVRLQIRPDRRVAHGAVKQVLETAREAGIRNVIFTAYTSDR